MASPTSTISHLLRELRQEPYVRRLLAARALAQTPSCTEAVEALCDVLTQDREAEVRAAAAQTLGNLADRRAVDSLLQALFDRSETVRVHASDALDMLLGASNARLLRLTQPHLDPDLCLYLMEERPNGPLAWLNQWSQRMLLRSDYALPTIYRAKELGDLSDVAGLCDLLEQPKSNYGAYAAQAMAAIARRHPSPSLELRRACEALRARALSAHDPAPYVTALRTIETLTGSNLPMPVTMAHPSAAHLPVVTNPTTAVPVPQPRPTSCSDAPASAFEYRFPLHLSAFKALGGEVYLLLCKCSLSILLALTVCPIGYWVGIERLLSFILAGGATALIRKLFHLVQTEVSAETVHCQGHELRIDRRLGPFCWARCVTLPPGARIQRVQQQPTWLQSRLNLSMSHQLGCLIDKDRPFRFGRGRNHRELDRLAAEINAYLEQQETYSPQPEQEAATELTQPSQVNRHAR